MGENGGRASSQKQQPHPQGGTTPPPLPPQGISRNDSSLPRRREDVASPQKKKEVMARSSRGSSFRNAPRPPHPYPRAKYRNRRSFPLVVDFRDCPTPWPRPRPHPGEGTSTGAAYKLAGSCCLVLCGGRSVPAAARSSASFVVLQPQGTKSQKVLCPNRARKRNGQPRRTSADVVPLVRLGSAL
jgi:hypothetical protein